jgi:F-type H+-transporting ATPase subunit b
MLIDWFTVGAQALNFLVLVWLMKRFLYKPILDAINARETLVAKQLAEASTKMDEAQRQRDEFARKNEDLDRQRVALIARATDEADAERRRLLDEGRRAAEAQSEKRREALAIDARNLDQAIRRRTQQEVFSVARKALADLAAASLEERMAEVFIDRLRAMDGGAKAAFAKALATASAAALVRSAFDLPERQRTAIEKAVHETFSGDIEVRFETAPDLVGGIELSANGQKIAWSISDYLASLEETIGELAAGPGIKGR